MIYLDHAATTACAPEVIEAMLPFFRDTFANASSIDHAPGIVAKRAVDAARESIAALVGAKPEDVIFTSGSTEANNLALSFRGPVLTTRLEHPSVLDPFTSRKRNDDQFVSVDRDGRVMLDDLKARLAAGSMVSVIATSNELGTEQNVEAIADIVNTAGAHLHLDATQAVGTRAIDIGRIDGLAGLSLSAHKIHGPKGIGALVATGAFRRGLLPVQRGGGHERGLRSGTLNVPGIVGFGVAAQLAMKQRPERRKRLEALRQLFLAEIVRQLGERVHETVSSQFVSPHVLSIRIDGVNGRALLGRVKDVAFSLGSACATNKAEPSHVLLALGIGKTNIAETIRISFAADQQSEDIRRASTSIGAAAAALLGYSYSV